MASRDGSRLLDALLAVYYQTEWIEEGLTPPEEVNQHLHVELPDLRMAVTQLTDGIRPPVEHAPRDLIADTTVRLGFAQLNRRALPDSGRTENSQVLPALQQMWERFAAQGYEEARQDFDDFKRGLAESPEKRFADAILNPLFSPITAHPIRNFWSRASYHARITDAAAGVEVERGCNEFCQFLDPRRWPQNVPQVWERSHLLDVVPLRRDGGGRRRVNQSTPADNGTLFEQAVWPSSTLVLARFRNLLEVQINVDPSSNPVGFEYQQRECLTSTMMGQSFSGGIDVDSGYARATQKNPGWCSLEARKRARFSQPPGFLNALYNGIAFVWLRLFIEGSVLLGSQF